MLLAACGDGSSGAASPEPEPSTRTAKLAGGDVEVPVEPQRVVVLQSFVVPHVLSLGVDPVGVGLADPTAGAESTVPSWSDAELDADVVTFDETAPDLEALAELDPDLFVAFREPPNVEQLERIAPVADVDRIALEWEELTAGVAEALGRPESLTSLVDAYEERVARFRAETLPDLDGRTVSTFRVRGPDELRIEVLDSFPGQVLEAAGVPRPEVQDVTSDNGFGYLEVSSERLSDADGDLLFPITYARRPQTRQDLAELSSTELWAGLEAVSRGAVHEVDGSAWFGGHPSAAIALLDDLAAAIDGELPTYPTP